MNSRKVGYPYGDYKKNMDSVPYMSATHYQQAVDSRFRAEQIVYHTGMIFAAVILALSAWTFSELFKEWRKKRAQDRRFRALRINPKYVPLARVLR